MDRVRGASRAGAGLDRAVDPAGSTELGAQTREPTRTAQRGFGAAAGLAGTLGITESRSALLGALFFLGYFAFQIPGILIARRFSSTRVCFVALLLWGVLAALTGIIRSFPWLAVER